MGKGNVFTHVCFSVHRGRFWSVGGVWLGGWFLVKGGWVSGQGVGVWLEGYLVRGGGGWVSCQIGVSHFSDWGGGLPFFRWVAPIFVKMGDPFPIWEYGQSAVRTHPTGIHT